MRPFLVRLTRFASPCPPAGSGLAFAHAAPLPWLETLLPSSVLALALSLRLALAALTQALAEIPAAQAAQAEPREIRIGVLSHRGDAATERTWAPTAEYLSAALPGQRFRIEPLDFAAIDAAVAANRIDFVLVNPAIYVNLEVRHRVSRIATLRNRVGERESNVFGGVIFTRSDRADIQDLEGLRGRSLMAVDPTSLGGFEMAWGELPCMVSTPGATSPCALAASTTPWSRRWCAAKWTPAQCGRTSWSAWPPPVPWH